MHVGIVVFPGTWSDDDTRHALTRIGCTSGYVWHESTETLSNFDLIILPGGFSYGDYLRPGAIAKFSPVMQNLKIFIDNGGFVIGICNGFQILCEAGLLPGCLTRNQHMRFICRFTNLKIENSQTPFTLATQKGNILNIPISHSDGNYQVDQATLHQLQQQNRIVMRYSSPTGDTTSNYNPNGSVDNIAAIISEEGNVLGMMPHPERACEDILSSSDGNIVFASVKKSI